MPLVRCIRACWDSQITKQYFNGDIADYPLDHVFLAGKTKCFEVVKPEDLEMGKSDAQVQLKKAFEMIGDLSRKIEGEAITKEPDPVGEKRPVGRPPKSG